MTDEELKDAGRLMAAQWLLIATKNVSQEKLNENLDVLKAAAIFVLSSFLYNYEEQLEEDPVEILKSFCDDILADRALHRQDGVYFVSASDTN